MDRLKHRQHLDPRRHPAQAAGSQELTKSFGDDRVQSRQL
jgi:hypothetical protein